MAPPSFLWVLAITLLALIQACSSAKIEWGPCKDGEFNSTLVIQCGTLRVPLDYSDQSSNKSLELELVKVLAAVQPSRGSIQINFGGPGVPTRETAVAAGPLLQLCVSCSHVDDGVSWALLIFIRYPAGSVVVRTILSDLTLGNTPDCEKHGNLPSS